MLPEVVRRRCVVGRRNYRHGPSPFVLPRPLVWQAFLVISFPTSPDASAGDFSFRMKREIERLE
jgi:hypothetical protein